MGLSALIVILIIGGIAGWLAGLIVKGFGFGLLGNIVVGIVGAFVASFLFPAAWSARSSTPRSARLSCCS
jgi:uncharacterized membrane protein YeaQ/YmgE (transglycosylase-associated protein family)